MSVRCHRVRVALLVVSTGSCMTMSRNGSDYKAFVASHDAIRPGMSVRQVFEAGVADYMVAVGSKNVPGATVSAKEPVSPECRRHVVDVGHAYDRATSRGGFTISVYCNMNGPSDRQLVPRRALSTKLDLLQALEAYSPWVGSMSFRVESPPLQIGGVYDSYEFSTDENGKIAKVSSIVKSGAGSPP